MIVVNYYMKHECIAKLLTPFLEVRADINNTEIKSLSGLAFLGCCLGLTCSKCCHR